MQYVKSTGHGEREKENEEKYERFTCYPKTILMIYVLILPWATTLIITRIITKTTEVK